MDKLLTVTQVAEILSCSVKTVERWLLERRLPRVKAGRLVRIRERDLQAFLIVQPAKGG